MHEELVQLPSFYADPSFLLLSRDQDQAVGCIGVRRLDASTAEIRRLFVRPEHRARGLGADLLRDATSRARTRGFTRLVLTTLPSMTAARRLYDQHGYVPIDAYVPDPVTGVEFLATRIDS